MLNVDDYFSILDFGRHIEDKAKLASKLPGDLNKARRYFTPESNPAAVQVTMPSIFGITSETPDDFKNNTRNQSISISPKSVIDELKSTNHKVNIDKLVNNKLIEYYENVQVIENTGLRQTIKIENVPSSNITLHKNIKRPQYIGNKIFWTMNETDNIIKDNRNKTLRVKRENNVNCSEFKLDNHIFHSPGYPGNYYSNMDCILQISAPNPDEDYIIILDFREKFHLEDNPNCTYDFLEIRDGEKGYADLIGRYCGDKFPDLITSKGPYLWLMFKSDSTIEYEGFTGVVNFTKDSNSKRPVPECFTSLKEDIQGSVGINNISSQCNQKSKGGIDAVWQIKVKTGWRIFLNFTYFHLAFPNECKRNFVDVFGEKTDMTDRQKNFCGSMAETVQSDSNVLHVRFFAVTDAMRDTNFTFHYTAYRSREASGSCDEETEFDCEDQTCIDKSLACDNWPNCRLKGDEDYERCKDESESIFTTHIIIILVIFSLILSTMSFIFVFKCIKKLVADHKIIKEHIRQSREDRLDMIASNKLTLDPRLLQPDMSRHRDSRDRDSLRRDNHRNNEMYKRQRSKDKHLSIDSDLIAETHIDLDDDTWHQDIDEELEIDDHHRDRAAKSKTQKKDSRKTEEREVKEKESKHKNYKESERKTTDKRKIDRKDTEKSEKKIDKRDTDRTIERRGTADRKGTLDRKDTERTEKEEPEEDRGRRSVSVGAPDTKESGCQTRESLFQGGTGASSDGTDSVSGARGFSTFGYSGSTLLPRRSSPPPPVSPPIGLTIELIKACQEPAQTQSKKMPDRRPMSTETTRSAPDVIIVSKPIR